MERDEILRRLQHAGFATVYDFSLINDAELKSKVSVLCPIHGEFRPRLDHLLDGHGCPLCSGKSRKTTERFIEDAKIVHGEKYDYSKVKYVNSHSKVEIVCPIHGSWMQKPTNHLNGNGCPMCKKDKNSAMFRSNIGEFIRKANAVYGNRYDYSNVQYVNNRTKVKILCREHGEFLCTPANHLRGRGCPVCNESHLEKEVRVLLSNSDLDFEMHRHFDWLGRQELDFYIPKKNIAIECQGKQHFGLGGWKDGFDALKNADIRKYDLCISNGVRLIYFFDAAYLNISKDIRIYSLDNVFTDTAVLLDYILSV